MGERPSDSGAGAGGTQDVTRSPRVVLVMVEVVCAEADVPELELTAAQWAQDVRFRHLMGAVETTDARSVVIDGSLGVMADVMRLAAKATQ